MALALKFRPGAVCPYEKSPAQKEQGFQKTQELPVTGN